MKKILITILTCWSIFSFNSCNYLDVEDHFDDTLAYDSIFINYENLHRYMWGVASYLPDESAIFKGQLGPMATDEAFTAMGKSEFKGLNYVLGGINEENISGESVSIWADMYKIIRKTNIILTRKHEANLTVPEDEEIAGYTHFLRAYAYYRLLMDYGPVILVGDVVYPSNESPAAYNKERATYDECVEYICEEFEIAAKDMPTTVSASFFGRPSKGTAFALIARLRLQHASPLFNGGAKAKLYYGGWKNKEGVNYISQTYDEKRWAVAAAAAKRVIDMGYKLHTVPSDHLTKPLPSNVPSANYPDGAGGIDPFRSYSEMFTGETFPAKNEEFIWARMSGEIRDFTKHAFPVLEAMGGWNCGLCVPQKIVDAYYMEDGRDRNNSSTEYPYRVSDNYDESYFTPSVTQFSGYTLPKGVYAMYQNREMRFYASIGFSGRHWPALSCTQNTYNRRNVFFHGDKGDFTAPDLFSGKGASSSNVNDYPSTGYVITKWIHPDDAWYGTGALRKNKPYAIIRFAEILLSYVEAVNNLSSSYTIELPSKEQGASQMDSYTISRNTSEMKEYFDLVRFRAGLPGLTSTELADPETMQNIIERERMIEFLFENRRYYDVRRWGIYEETEKAGIYGMNADSRDKFSYYKTPVPVNHANNRNRIIDPKLIFLPLPKSEVRRVEDLVQNPGWGN